MDRFNDKAKFSEKYANESGRPMWLAGSVLGNRCHVCAFFSNRDEEYQVLLPFIRDGLSEQKRIARELEEKVAQRTRELQDLKDQLQRENVVLREQVDEASMFEEIIGTAAVPRSVLSRVAKVAPTDSSVLITGETGMGKELIARAIHKGSVQSPRAFVKVSCAAIPPSLIASELFGHEKAWKLH
jgi:transcriptional regulator with PAS, ATPase and Fis domain